MTLFSELVSTFTMQEMAIGRVTDEVGDSTLAPYIPRLVIEWARDTPEARWRELEGTLAFVDISGFTDVRTNALLAHRTQVDPNSPFWFGLPDEENRTLHPYDDYVLARSLIDTSIPEDDLFFLLHVSRVCGRPFDEVVFTYSTCDRQLFRVVQHYRINHWDLYVDLPVGTACPPAYQRVYGYYWYRTRYPSIVLTNYDCHALFWLRFGVFYYGWQPRECFTRWDTCVDNRVSFVTVVHREYQAPRRVVVYNWARRPVKVIERHDRDVKVIENRRREVYKKVEIDSNRKAERGERVVRPLPPKERERHIAEQKRQFDEERKKEVEIRRREPQKYEEYKRGDDRKDDRREPPKKDDGRKDDGKKKEDEKKNPPKEEKKNERKGEDRRDDRKDDREDRRDDRKKDDGKKDDGKKDDGKKDDGKKDDGKKDDGKRKDRKDDREDRRDDRRDDRKKDDGKKDDGKKDEGKKNDGRKDKQSPPRPEQRRQEPPRRNEQRQPQEQPQRKQPERRQEPKQERKQEPKQQDKKQEKKQDQKQDDRKQDRRR